MSFFPPRGPYPPDRYDGPAGEVSALWRPDETGPDLRMGDGTGEYLLTGAQTHGDVGLYRWRMAPRQPGPAPHFHRALSESFYVLDGEVTIHDGERWRPAGPGDFVHVPEGGVHGFRNDSDAPASMLILFAPGAPREAYFEGVAHVAATGEQPSPEDKAEFDSAHDTYWV